MVTGDEIKKWKNEGWTFRVKKVKGKNYISRRKGKDEKGLGQFDEDLWRLIQDITIESMKSNSIYEVRKAFEGIIMNLRTYHMVANCSHIIEGFCNYWKYDTKIEYFNAIDQVIGKGYYKHIVPKRGSPYWIFKAVDFFCKNCPAFKQ